MWSIFYVAGIIFGGYIAVHFLMIDSKVNISGNTVNDLAVLGITDFSSYLPGTIFSWGSLFSAKGFVFIALGGFLVGFGTRYANGCTSGHSIPGLANFQFGSLIATISFFIGGLVMTHLLLPILMQL